MQDILWMWNQELALLRIRKISALSGEFAGGYKVRYVLVLLKGARVIAAIGNKPRSAPTSALPWLNQIASSRISSKMPGVRKLLTAADYYPHFKMAGGQTRELRLADSALLEAIIRYLDEHMAFKNI